MRVKLKTKFGQFWDRKLRWGITAGEVKDLPEPLSQDSLTYQKLRLGGFEIVRDTAPASEPKITPDPAVSDESVSPEIAAPMETAITEAEPEPDVPVDTPVAPEPKTAAKKRGRPRKTK